MHLYMHMLISEGQNKSASLKEYNELYGWSVKW